MKSFITVGVLVAAVAAQTLGDLPQCGQNCVNAMLGKAPSLGCTASDAACLCKNMNFYYGIRDCSSEACGADVSKQVVAFGTGYCKAAGVTIGGDSGAGGSGGASGSGSGSGAGATTLVTSPSATVTETSTGTGAAGGAGGAGGSGGSGSSVAITTSAIVSVETSDGSSSTVTVGSTTIFGAGGAGGAGGSGSGSNPTGTEDGASAITTSAIESLITSDGSTITSIIGSTTIFGGGAGGAGSSVSSAASGASSSASDIANGASSSINSIKSAASSGISSISSAASGATGSSSTSTGGGAYQTAAPGIMAVAGLAAFLL